MYDKFVTAKGRVVTARITGSGTGGEVAAAVTGKKLRLLSIMVTTDTAGNLTVRDNAGTPNVLVGPAPLADNGGFCLPHNPNGWGDSAAGQNLNVLLSASATTYGGVLVYQVLAGE